LTSASGRIILRADRMSKEQFWTLNAVGGACALLLLANLILGQFNQRTNQELLLLQEQLNHAQQMQATMQNLAVRIAQAGRTDPALRALLARQDLKVTLASPEKPAKPNP
jgi:hypothetical protein